MTPSSSFTTLKLQDDGTNKSQHSPPPPSFGDVEQGPSSSILPTLYHVRRTISSPIVQTLVELGLAHTTVRIQELSFADLKSTEYRQRVNPMGTSPAFCDPDVQMWESGAILDYLLEMYDPHGQYWCCPGRSGSRQKDHPQLQQLQRRAKYLQLKQYLIATVYPLVAAWYLRRWEQPPRQPGGKQQEQQEQQQRTEQQQPATVDEADERARETFRTVIGPYLTRCLGDGPYFMDDQFTVLDLIAAKPFTNLHQLGELAAFPLLQAHFDRISSRPSYQEAYYGRESAVRTTTPTPFTTPEMVPVDSPPVVAGTAAAARSLAVARVSWCAGEVPAVTTNNNNNNKKQRTGSITATTMTTTTTAAPCHSLAVTTTTAPPPPPAIRS